MCGCVINVRAPPSIHTFVVVLPSYELFSRGREDGSGFNDGAAVLP